MTTQRVGRIVLPNTGGSIIGRVPPTAGAPAELLGKRPLNLKAIQEAFDAKVAPQFIEAVRARNPKAADSLAAQLSARSKTPAPATSSSDTSSSEATTTPATPATSSSTKTTSKKSG